MFFPNFLAQQLNVSGQGASFLGFLTRDPLLIWNTVYVDIVLLLWQLQCQL